MTNNNLNPLPWYTDIKDQQFRNWREKFSLITPTNNLLPFQIKRASQSGGITSAILYDPCGTQIADITNDLNRNINVVQVDGYDILINYASVAFSTLMPIGFYYAVITDGVNTWYSELFRVINNTDRYIRIDYRSDTHLRDVNGNIQMYYDTQYINTLYFEAQLSKPEYILEEASDSRDTIAFDEKLVAKKVFHFAAYAPEFLIDALQGVFLADSVYITANRKQYKSTHYMFTPTWLDGLHYAGIDHEFDTDNVLKSISLGIIEEQIGIDITARMLNILTSAGVNGATVELYSGFTFMANLFANSSGLAEKSWIITESAYNALTKNPQIYAVKMVSEEYKCTDSAIVFSGDRTSDILFTTPSSTTIQCLIMSWSNPSYEYMFRSGMTVEYRYGSLYIYIAQQQIAYIPNIPNANVQLIIRKASTTITVDAYVVSTSGQEPMFKQFQKGIAEWSGGTALTINNQNADSMSSMNSIFIHLREFNRILSDVECKTLNNHGHPELYTLSVALSSCVANFIPETLPTPINNPWPSSIGNAKFNPSGSGLTAMSANNRLKWLMYADTYFDAYSETGLNAPTYASALANGIDMGIEKLIPLSAITISNTNFNIQPGGASAYFYIESPLYNIDSFYIPRIVSKPNWFTLTQSKYSDTIYMFNMVIPTIVGTGLYSRSGIIEVAIGKISKYIQINQTSYNATRLIDLPVGTNLKGKTIQFQNTNLLFDPLWGGEFINGITFVENNIEGNIGVYMISGASSTNGLYIKSSFNSDPDIPNSNMTKMYNATTKSWLKTTYTFNPNIDCIITKNNCLPAIGNYWGFENLVLIDKPLVKKKLTELPIGYNLTGKTIYFENQNLRVTQPISGQVYQMQTRDNANVVSPGIRSEVITSGIDSLYIFSQDAYKETAWYSSLPDYGWMIRDYTFDMDHDYKVIENTLFPAVNINSWGFNKAVCFSHYIPLTKLPAGYNLRGKTIYFKRTHKPINPNWDYMDIDFQSNRMIYEEYPTLVYPFGYVAIEEVPNESNYIPGIWLRSFNNTDPSDLPSTGDWTKIYDWFSNQWLRTEYTFSNNNDCIIFDNNLKPSEYGYWGFDDAYVYDPSIEQQKPLTEFAVGDSLAGWSVIITEFINKPIMPAGLESAVLLFANGEGGIGIQKESTTIDKQIITAQFGFDGATDIYDSSRERPWLISSIFIGDLPIFVQSNTLFSGQSASMWGFDSAYILE